MRSDAELVRDHRCGDPRAFAVLHERYAPALRRHARRVVGEASAEDVVQDAFERAHRFALEDPRAAEAGFLLGAWLHTVLHRRCIDELRLSARGVPAFQAELADRRHEPHERAVLAAELRHLVAAVVGLPVRQREAFVRHVLGGEPHHAIAASLQVSVAATKGLVNRARVELRDAAAFSAAG